MIKKAVGIVVLAGVLGFVLFQLVPYGKDHANPPVVQEPNWDSAETRALAQRACFDCHSNETVWPWYSNVAPPSWLLAWDIAGGKEAYNFSDWHAGDVSPEMAARAIRRGDMPPSRYLMLHPEARLTDAEREQLAQGLSNSLE